MEEYLANGMQLGWLINPRTRQVHVYRIRQSVQIIASPPLVAGDPELPGLVVDLLVVWEP